METVFLEELKLVNSYNEWEEPTNEKTVFTTAFTHLILLKVIWEHIMLPEQDFTSFGLLQTHYEFQQSTLSTSIWTNDCNFLSSFNCKICPIK